MNCLTDIRRMCFGIGLAILIATNTHAFQQTVATSNPSEPALDKATWQSLVEVCQTIEANHVSPPTRQQMVLDAVRGLYLGFDKLPPRGLANEASALNNPQQMYQFANQHLQRIANDGIKPNQLLNIMVTSIVRSIDPAARLVNPKQLRVDQQLAENRYVGIGIQLAFENNRAVITEPFVGGAARNAGSEPGDVILEVDGKSMDGKNLGQIVDILRGEMGTKVSVKVKNKHSGETRLMHMTRTRIPIPSAKGLKRNDDDSWNYTLSKQKKLAALKIEKIVGSTAAEVRQRVVEIDEQGFDFIVLDLRVSGDIDFHHAEMLADALVPSIEIGTFFDGEKSRRIQTRAQNCLNGKKVFVIANRYATGPQLLVLTALKKSGAVFVGSRTQGNPGCGARVLLPNHLGAIANFKTGVFWPKMEPETKGITRTSQMPSNVFIEPDYASGDRDHVARILELLSSSDPQ